MQIAMMGHVNFNKDIMIEPKRKTVKVSEQNTYPKSKDWEYEVDVYETAGTVNVDNKILKVGKGFAPHGGMMLKNIYNQNFRMAYDIGVIGIYVTPNKEAMENGGHKTKFLILGPPDFIQLDNNYNILTPDKDFNPFVQTKEPKMSFNPFSITPSGFDGIGTNMDSFNEDRESEINVKYRSNYELFGEGSGYLIIEQKFIFTKYDKEPAHEPGGLLTAARLHPIIRLRFEKHKRETVDSFRVDYRLYLNLDSWITQQTFGIERSTVRLVERKTLKEKIKNAAGVFKDYDSTSSINVVTGDMGVANVVFRAAEKPLVAEILTEGLINNIKKSVWDNIHWWGAGKSWAPGSTPGSFHAIHIHWRWGKELQNKEDLDVFNPLAPAKKGAEQFKGKGYEGELTDPEFFKQTLDIAVAVNNDSFTSDTSDPKKYIYNYQLFKNQNEVFGKLFKDIHTAPQNISDGGDIILFYSATIKLSDSKSYSKTGILDGSFFVHGLFFAHEPEKDTIKAGNLYSFYKNPSKAELNSQKPQKWERNPE